MSTLRTVSDDAIRKALSALPRRTDVGVPSGYVRIAANDVKTLPFEPEAVEAWIRERDGYPDERRRSRDQLGSGASARRAPKVARSSPLLP